MESMEVQKQQMSRLMQEFAAGVLPFYQEMKGRDVYQEAGPDTLARLRAQGIPREGRPVEEVFREMLEDVYAPMTLVQHPRCFACIPSPVSLFSWMGDVMTSAFDPHAERLRRGLRGAGGHPLDVRPGGVSPGGGRAVCLRRLPGQSDRLDRRPGRQAPGGGAEPWGGLCVGADPLLSGQRAAHHRIPGGSNPENSHRRGFPHEDGSAGAGRGRGPVRRTEALCGDRHRRHHQHRKR